MRAVGWVALAGLAACAAPEEGYVLDLPEGFPAPVIPADNPLTAEKIELGRHLFYETRLSGNETQSCGSCHLQELAFTDGRTVGLGSTGAPHARNVNGLTNVAYNSTLTWANPLLTDLETQMLLPLFGDDPVEMGAAPGQDAVLARIADDPAYQERFAAAYPKLDAPVTWDTTIGAIASFMRTLISGDSPFDRFAYQGDGSALSPTELRGLELFYSERLECHHCHGGFNFSEASVHADSVFDAALFHNTGLYDVDGQGAYPANNTGVYAITGDPADMGRFRPPSLRNVAVTAPYLHDGSAATLEEVVRIYERGGRLVEDGPNAGDGAESPLKSGLVPGFELTDAERDDLIAFLGSLTDTRFLEDPRFAPP
ncbi:MAG: di-heme enzyme [Alphaproteobacteria bacterium]|nr:di-heme enzyme [Alphaproteobacteria bacterium]